MLAQYFLLLCVFTLGCHGLTCRSEGTLNDNDLKKVYSLCLKRQEGNSSDNRHSTEQDWGDETHRTKDKIRNGSDKVEGRSNGSRDKGMKEMRDRDRMEGREAGQDMYNAYDDKQRDKERGDRNNNGNRNERDRSSMGNRDNLSGRDDFLQSEEYGGKPMRDYNTQTYRRNKREKRVEMNSGQRSQYNPNAQKNSGSEKMDDYKTSNTSKEEDKACTLHCFLENMQMTGENGMPDRYLVTHAITANVKNEDLKDFLQESIEECFQILDNDHTEDKCEFSKNLMLCLSEKGRANCDDWKNEYQF